MQEIKLDKIEAIYINPKWKSSKVGDFLTYNNDKKKKKKKNETLSQLKASSKFDSQKDKVDFKIEPKAEDSSEDEKTTQTQSGGVTIEDFQRLRIPDDVMKDGMLFIWVEKEYIMEIVRHLETQNFFYVENVCYVMLQPAMEKGKFTF